MRTLAFVICAGLFAMAAGAVLLVLFAIFASAGAAVRIAGPQHGYDARPGIEDID